MKKTITLLGMYFLCTPFFFGQEMPQFNSDAEKAAWIKEHPQDYERISGEKVTLIPTFSTSEEKEAWIKANPEQYQSLGGDSHAVQTSAEPSLKEIVINPNDPTFPKFIMTGNPEQDAKDFEVKKKAWFEAKEAQNQAQEHEKELQEKLSRQSNNQ